MKPLCRAASAWICRAAAASLFRDAYHLPISSRTASMQAPSAHAAGAHLYRQRRTIGRFGYTSTESMARLYHGIISARSHYGWRVNVVRSPFAQQGRAAALVRSAGGDTKAI